MYSQGEQVIDIHKDNFKVMENSKNKDVEEMEETMIETEADQSMMINSLHNRDQIIQQLLMHIHEIEQNTSTNSTDFCADNSLQNLLKKCTTNLEQRTSEVEKLLETLTPLQKEKLALQQALAAAQHQINKQKEIIDKLSRSVGHDEDKVNDTNQSVSISDSLRLSFGNVSYLPSFCLLPDEETDSTADFSREELLQLISHLATRLASFDKSRTGLSSLYLDLCKAAQLLSSQSPANSSDAFSHLSEIEQVRKLSEKTTRYYSCSSVTPLSNNRNIIDLRKQLVKAKLISTPYPTNQNHFAYHKVKDAESQIKSLNFDESVDHSVSLLEAETTCGVLDTSLEEINSVVKKSKKKESIGSNRLASLDWLIEKDACNHKEREFKNLVMEGQKQIDDLQHLLMTGKQLEEENLDKTEMGQVLMKLNRYQSKLMLTFRHLAMQIKLMQESLEAKQCELDDAKKSSIYRVLKEKEHLHGKEAEWEKKEEIFQAAQNELTEAHEQKIAEMTAKYIEKQGFYQAQLLTLNGTVEEKEEDLIKLKSSYDRQIENLLSDSERKILNIHSEHDKEVAVLKANFKKNMSDLDRHHQHKVTSLKQACKKFETEKDEMMENLKRAQDKANVCEEQLLKQTTDIEDKLQESVLAHQEGEKNWKKKIDLLQKELYNLEEDYRSLEQRIGTDCCCNKQESGQACSSNILKEKVLALQVEIEKLQKERRSAQQRGREMSMHLKKKMLATNQVLENILDGVLYVGNDTL